MNHDQNATEGIHPERHEALLSKSVRIFDRDGVDIAQRLLCVCEADLVFGEVRPRLGWIKLDLHASIMRMRCISSSGKRAIAGCRVRRAVDGAASDRARTAT